MTFKAKSWISTPKTIKLLGSSKIKIKNDENGGLVPYLEITEVALKHCNVVNNSYEHNSRVLYTFVTNKLLCQLLDISSKKFIFSKTFDSKFSYIKVWLTDQNCNLLEIEYCWLWFHVKVKIYYSRQIFFLLMNLKRMT